MEKKHYILQKVACLWSESSQNFKWKLISCVKAPKVCEIQNKYKQIEKDNSSAGLEIWERHISSAFLKKFSSARHLILCFQFVPSLISTFQFIFLIHKSLFYVHFTLHFACTLFPLTLWLVPIIMHPTGRHPLWFAFQRIDLGQQLLISTICVVVYDYHIEEMTPACLHVAGSGYNVLKLLLLLSVMRSGKLKKKPEDKKLPKIEWTYEKVFQREFELHFYTRLKWSLLFTIKILALRTELLQPRLLNVPYFRVQNNLPFFEHYTPTKIERLQSQKWSIFNPTSWRYIAKKAVVRNLLTTIQSNEFLNRF